MDTYKQAPRSTRKSPQLIERTERENGFCFLYCADTVLEVSVCAPHILRFRFAPEERFERDFSYAIAGPEGRPATVAEYEFREAGDVYEILTSELTCRITRSLHISIWDKNGFLISEDERGYYWEPNTQYGGNIVYCSKKLQEQESFFGLGDKSNWLNMRGMRFENWCSDMYGFEKTTDPLYKAIPFYFGLHHKKAYGILFDNPFRTRFDFGHTRGEVATFWGEGGEMRYYFIYGPELVRVAEGYVQLTGTPELPPLWALGYHQSKWSYYPESAVTAVAAEFRKRKIPCDAIHIDIDYMDAFRVFTWHGERFPDPRRMMTGLEVSGFKTVIILDPGIKIDKQYAVYQEGVAAGHFCRRADGPMMEGNVWPGRCHFPDFTRPKVRDWWSGMVRDFSKAGVDGIWCDMNEPAIIERSTFPADTRHDYDGTPCSHRKAHNVYGMQMARATLDGLKQAIFPKRPFVLSRAGFAGMQRYAATWTGDNLSTWDHLWMANIQCQRLSISGVSFCGSDIGGFIGEATGELYTRWMQMAVLHPFFRTHSSGDYGDQEPWSFGEPYTSAIRKAIELRYQLLPYIYTVFWRHTQSGTPMILPLTFMDQEDPETYFRMEEFSLGNQLLVCPIAAPNVKGRRMYLPKGQWYNYWTDAPQASNTEFFCEAPIDRMPLFVRAGSAIPHYPVMQYTGEKDIEVLDIHLYYLSDGSCTSELYEDAGDYFEYEQGNYMIRTFTLQTYAAQATVQQRKKGRFNSSYTRYRFILHGFPYSGGIAVETEDEKVRVKKVVFNEMPLPCFEVDKNFEELVIRPVPGEAAKPAAPAPNGKK
ncbi:MAG: glycoside hydrolase family 31 protein [Bacteroidia bacterium]|nr:glycoside hydrolase family 31 protein [Bacteroidia bacterium]